MAKLFDYAPAPESRDIARLKPSYQIFVDGKFRDGAGEAIKTINPAATPPVALVMLEAARDFRDRTGDRRGVKLAGGIRTTKEAVRYLVMVNEVAGDDWLTPALFRFGASSLLNDLLLQRHKLRTGAYDGPDYVTVD